MLFVDKYSPRSINDVSFHQEEINILKNMSEDKSVPHIIFHGGEGVGKKTLINFFLEMMYNKDIYNLTESIYKVSTSGNKVIDVPIKQSNYHIVIEPNNNNSDRYLIQDVVCKYAQKMPLEVFTSKKTFKVVLINNIDNLPYYAQTSLRRTMEKYSETCRFIMWCKTLSKVIEPIRSRCYSFKVSAPTNDDIFKLLYQVSVKESIDMKLGDYLDIITLANRNVKKALWLLEYKSNDIAYGTSYDYVIHKITNKILNYNNTTIIDIRQLEYKIMITNIKGSQILKDIVKNLYMSDKLTEKCKLNIAEIAANFEYNLIKGRREVNHLDGFIAGIIYAIETYNN